MAVLTSVVLWGETEHFFRQEAKLKSLSSMHAFLPILYGAEIQLPVRLPQEVNFPTHIRGRPQVH